MVWKFEKFSAIQILREINFHITYQQSKSSKPIFAIIRGGIKTKSKAKSLKTEHEPSTPHEVGEQMCVSSSGCW